MGLNNEKDRNIDEKFDMVKKAKKQAWYLKPLAWALSFPDLWARKSVVNKVNMEGLKPPYVLLCTHHAFLDFKVTTKCIFPHGGTYIVAIDGFIKREGIMRQVGCIGKRKFINDSVLVRQLKYSIDKLKQTVIIYPEARYSICGTNAILPDSLGKLCKVLKTPVVVLNMHGHYINSSVWNLKSKKTPVECDMTQILTKEDLANLPVEEINKRIKDAFIYDEYAWQKKKGILVKDKHRAEGLEKVLYKCPNCMSEKDMTTTGTTLTCENCHNSYNFNEDGSIQAAKGESKFSHIPDWYEWERSCVKEEILKGKYKTEDTVLVYSLPNSKGFISMGEGHFCHDANGLKVTFVENGVNKLFTKKTADNYSCHIEFNYNNIGDCVSFSEGDDTYYFFFKNLKNIIVKVHFAVEELYKLRNIINN